TKFRTESTNGATRMNAKTSPSAVSVRTTVVAAPPLPMWSFRSVTATTGSSTSTAKSEKKSVRTASRTETSAQATERNAAAMSSVRRATARVSPRFGPPNGTAVSACTASGPRSGRDLLPACAKRDAPRVVLVAVLLEPLEGQRRVEDGLHELAEPHVH